MQEAARCLHCDCRDLEHCVLRELSDRYGAQQKRFQGRDRQKVVKHMQHDLVIYEPSKCIRCGICVEICREHREKLGFTFIGRGFDVVVGVPFQGSVREGLEKAALEAVRDCPTGALAMKNSSKSYETKT
jgi:NADH dehydrogenase/NADH:ubiquinone oxidoreductase subunit G